MKILRCQLTLLSFNYFLLKHASSRILEMLNYYKVANNVSIVPLPNKYIQYTVNKSPFIDKKSREQFKQLTFKLLLTMNNVERKTLLNILNVFAEDLPCNLSIKVRLSFKEEY